MLPTPPLPDTIRVEHSDDSGRGLHTVSDIKQGDIVVEEAPIVSCSVSGGEHACTHCQRSLLRISDVELPGFLTKEEKYTKLWPTGAEEVIVCDCGERFCSKQCSTAAHRAYHSLECKVVPQLQALRGWLRDNKGDGFDYSDAVLLAIRMVLIEVQATDPPFKGFSAAMPIHFESHLKFYSPQIDAVLSSIEPSCTHNALQTSSEEFQHIFRVALTNSMGFAKAPKHIFFTKVQTLISASLFEDNETAAGGALDPMTLLTPAERGETEGLVKGVGLYSMLSLINHACLPSCGVNAVATNDHNLRVVCLRPISAGSQITLSYLQLNPDVPDNEKLLCRQQDGILLRRNRLRSHWGFRCGCAHCTAQSEVISSCVTWVKNTLLPSASLNRLLESRHEGYIPHIDAQYDAVITNMTTADAPKGNIEARLKSLAESKSHQPSYHTLGCIYAGYDGEGCGVAKDSEAAVTCLGMASCLNAGFTLNSPLSWATLSEVLFERIEAGTAPPSYVEGAILMLRAAADQGFPRAQASLAFYLSEAYIEEAWQWVEAATRQGELQAVYLAAQWARDGHGLAKPNLPMGM